MRKLDMCKNCGCTSLSLIEEVNPETKDDDMIVIMQCDQCSCEDTFNVPSYHFNETIGRILM